MTGVQLNEREIFTSHYASLCNTLTDVNNLLPHFVERDIISTSDEEEINAIVTTAKKVKKLLSHISGPLTAGDPKGFHMMLTIMEEYGNQSTKDLAVKIMTSSNNSKMEHAVTNDNRHQEPSDTSYLHTSNPTKPATSSEQPTVKTADPLSVQFSTFVATIEALLETRHDKLEQSKRICSNLTISNNSDELLFNDEQLQKINACTTFSELFTILRKHWSWKDYSILIHIISIVGLKEAKDEVEFFETRMASYQGMKIISESISPGTIPPGYIKLIVLIDKPYRDLTLEKFKELRDFVFSNLDVKHYIALPFIKFLFSSLQLEWYVLKKAASHMIKMAEKNTETFMSNSVMFIQVDQFVVLDCKAKEVDDNMQINDAKSSSDYRSGGYEYDFVDTPPDRLVCKICQLPCHEAQQSGCCGSVYCKCDIDQHKATTTAQPACPMCRSEDFVTYPNLAIDREVQQLMVYCPAKKTTKCDWIGKLDDVDKHYSDGKECETECEKCTTTVKHKLLRSHLDTECPCYCPYCDMTAEREVISSEHKENCHKFPLTCPNNCGLDNIPRDNMEEHKKVCPLEMIQCEFHDVGCEVQYHRKDEESHTRDRVTTHLQLAQRQLTILNKMLEDSNARHLESTEKFTELLTDLQERVENVNQPLSKNQLTTSESVNVEVQTDLSASNVGMATRIIQYYTMSRDSKILTFAFIMAIMTLAASISLYTLQAHYYNSTTTADYGPPTVQEFHEKASTVLYEIIDQSTLPWRTKLHYWSNIATIVIPVVLKFSEFSKQRHAILESSTFYGFSNGYLMRLIVYPSGYSGITTKNNYMSVLLDFKKGPNDDTLDRLDYFPVNILFTVELLDPNGDSHLQKEIHCNISRVTSDHFDGCRFLHFVPLGGYNFEQKCTCDKESPTICCYITDDDTIYFRVQEGKQDN